MKIYNIERLDSKMNKRGIGSVVGVSLLILLGIAMVSVFLGFYIRSISNATEDESALCPGIDIKVKGCAFFNSSDLNRIGDNAGHPVLSSAQDPGVLANIERFYGGGDISGLKLIVIDSSGRQHPIDPVNIVVGPFTAGTDYSYLVEFNSIEAVGLNMSFLDDSNLVGSLAVAPTVGKSKTVCQPTRPPVPCAKVNF